MAARSVACSCILFACCLGAAADARSNTNTPMTKQPRHQAKGVAARSLMRLASRKQHIHLEVGSPDTATLSPGVSSTCLHAFRLQLCREPRCMQIPETAAGGWFPPGHPCGMHTSYVLPSQTLRMSRE